MTIQQFFTTRGAQQVSGVDSSFSLEKDDGVWFVEQGGIELFSTDLQTDGTPGRRLHLCSLKPGMLLFGMSNRFLPPDSGCIATLQQESVLYRLDRQALTNYIQRPENIDECGVLIDEWVENLTYSLTRNRRETCLHFLQSGEEIEVEIDQPVGCDRELLWARLLVGDVLYLGMHPLKSSSLPFPLAVNSWLHTATRCRLGGVKTAEILKTPQFFPALEGLHAALMHCWSIEKARALKFEADRIALKRKRDLHAMRESLEDFVSILHPEKESYQEEDPQDILFSACLRIGKAQGITFHAPPQTSSGLDHISEICKASKIRKRTIRLEQGWQCHEHGPILGFLTKEQRPVALLPVTPLRYNVFDPVTRKTTPVTDTLIKKLQPDGLVFYRPFSKSALNVFSIFQFSVRGSGLDFSTIITMSIVAALLGLIPPLVSAQIFDTVIPDADRGMLFQYGIALLAAAIGTATFHLTRSFATLRAETRMDSSLQYATMDRLLSLAPPFFRKYTVGDLASRVNAITTIRQHLTGVALSSILSGIFSVFYLIILFFYSIKLAIVAILATVLPFLVTVVSGYFEIKYGRELLDIKGKIAGIVLQFLTGLSKLRVAGAEYRAFAVWATSFAREKKAAYKVGMVSNVFATFHGIYPIIAIGIIYYMASFHLQESLSTGSFIAFVTAYGSFMAAILGIGGTLVSVMRVIPLYERAQPILIQQPEVQHDQVYPGVLDGTIDVNNVSFRYDEDSPLILSNFNLKVHSGQSVAIVGPSGSGKSTLLRLLLGFEKPEHGTIFYSNQNLQNIDVQRVRQQIGTVLQGGRVIAGDIFVNIVGSSPLTIDDAWRAAKQAGFEQDIRNMPMGMHTYISEGGTNLSGGQRQRLLIARAFAMNPRIMFFDEATSALDNETQRIVSKSMDDLNITRLIIAHRLSTIKNTDIIYVINRGQVEQKGTFHELLEQDGLFASLAKRQLV
ncbi:MAG: NHLP bacteriocin export ABC transporter permease/ATPase subunit [Desulfobacterales bacterium]|nr:NHLP bacteriocin export ABC transporter permease/ATPase subunit [Desulfobacterales bacterium]